MSRIAIIGSGLGGLTAGCLLAHRGHEVTIWESHVTPGGYTAGFWRDGHYFESGTLSFESSSMVFAAMKELGVHEQIGFIPQRSRFLGRAFDFIPEDYPHFKESLLKAFPDYEKDLEKYFVAVDPMVAAMRKIMGPGRNMERLSGGLKFACQYLKYRKTTLGDFTAKFFARESPLFRIFKNFGYPDMSAWLVGGAVATVLYDYWTVKDGMQSWADVLAEKFKSLGGKMIMKTAVERIRTMNGIAVGVTAHGEEHRADWVIAACDYKKTFLRLLDNPDLVPKKMLERTRNNPVSEGIVTVYLGLNLSNEELLKRMKVAHLMIIDEQTTSDIRDSNDTHYFEKAPINAYSPSIHNEKLSPTGKSSLMIQAAAPYRWWNNWGGGDREQYRKIKERMKNVLIEKVASAIPEIKNRILFSDAATPLTYERFTGNTDGATSAWSWNPSNKFYKSSLKTYVETPVNRLLIGSCWASQIGGVPGALSAAKACAAKISRSAKINQQK